MLAVGNFRALFHLGNILSRAENFSRADDNHASYLRIFFRIFKRDAQLIIHFKIKRIRARRTIQS